jgi:hypothetical protein
MMTANLTSIDYLLLTSTHSPTQLKLKHVQPRSDLATGLDSSLEE